MSQLTFAEAEYAIKKRKTRREKFLEEIDNLIPWQRLEKKLAKYYPRGGNGRPPYPLAVMLRVHCMQLFYNLSDPGMEDALYEVESMRRFAGLRLSDALPDETTILNFRHFLERHQLGKALFHEINAHLQQKGLLLREGTIVDATIISAPASTKNANGKRDAEMCQTKKGQESYFGMKLHIGVDDALGLIHSLETTAANVHDITQVDKVLHGDEKRAWGDAGFVGIEKRAEHCARRIDWFIAQRPGKIRWLPMDSDVRKTETVKASVRAKVEFPFLWIKKIFGYSKVRYRGLKKNTERLHVLAGFANLMLARRFMAA